MAKYKTYDNKAAYDAAAKDTTQSVVSLIKDDNEIVYDGVNVVVDTPHVGAVVVFDKNENKKRFIAKDTCVLAKVPDHLVIGGIVYDVQGTYVRMLSTDQTFASQKWKGIYTYIISAWNAEGGRSSMTVGINGKDTTFSFSYGANTSASVLASTLQISYNGATSYAGLVKFVALEDDTIEAQILEYTTNTGVKCSADGLTITASTDGMHYCGSVHRNTTNHTTGNTYLGGYNAARCVEYYSTNGYTTTGDADLNTVKDKPLALSVFNATDNPLTYAMYGGSYERYIKEWWCIRFPYPKVANRMDDKGENTRTYGNMTYVKSDGTVAPKFPAMNYILNSIGKSTEGYTTGFEAGKWWLASFVESYLLRSKTTYGLSEVALASSDVVSRNFKLATNRNPISATTHSCSSSRNSANTAWLFHSGGGMVTGNCHSSSPTVAVSAFDIND